MATDLNNDSVLKAQWEAALQEAKAAEAALDEFDRNVWTPAYEREKAFAEANGLICGKTLEYNRRLKELLERHPEYAIPDRVHDEIDRLGDAVDQLRTRLMKLQAPDLAALRWKLDQVLKIDNEDSEGEGSTPCWAGPYVRQTIADFQRLLPC